MKQRIMLILVIIFMQNKTQGSTAIGGSDPTIVRDTSGLCMG